MRLLLALLALLLTACATPTEFHRGVRPAPPPLRPGHGAPVVGQPGQTAPPPRSPHARVLPPSEEKGIWASHPPPAAPTAVLGVQLPLPESPSKDDTLLVRVCANTLNSAVQRTYTPETYSILSPEARRCLAAHLFAECLRRTLAKSEEEGTKQPLARALAGPARDALPRTARFQQEACQGTSIPGFVSVNRIMDEWLAP